VVDYVPGVKLGDRLEDGSYDATVTVKFGPAKVMPVVLAAFAKVDRNRPGNPEPVAADRAALSSSSVSRVSL
jgi:hypothetical protein